MSTARERVPAGWAPEVAWPESPTPAPLQERLAAALDDPQVAAFLAGLEERLEHAVAWSGGPAAERGAATLEAGGKRLRPLLVLLSAPMAERRRPGLERAAAAVELVHMASLVHDDVLDRAALRRGLPTVWSTHGVAAATATGDLLFARAFAVLAETGDEQALAMLAECAVGLSLGEALQLQQTRRPATTVDQYLERCGLKTGRLFAAACALGGRLGGADARAVEALAEYGRLLGLAFQVGDDVLDCDGDPDETGKALGTDLVDGTATLPLLLAARLEPAIAAALERPVAPREVLPLLALVGSCGALAEARAVAHDLVGRAEAALAALDERFDISALRAVARAAIDRDR